MDSFRPISPYSAPVFAVGQPERTGEVSAARPRRDVPPVTRTVAPAPIAPRPPDQSSIGLVQAGLMAGGSPAQDYSPERALKPWGVAILPDAESAEARREAEAARLAEAEATAERTAPDDGAALPEMPPAPVAADREPPAEVPADPQTPPAPD